MSESAVQIEALSVWAGKRPILSNVSFRVEPHRVLAVIGPSGSGKSTLIRCLNRMFELEPNVRVEGRVRIDGDDIYAANTDVTAVRRKVGLVFQQPAVFSHLSIKENVLAGVRMTAPRDLDFDAIVERALRRAALFDELKDRLDEPAIALSAGERQRLCIARALTMEPAVLLLDEPTASLDPIATARVEGLIEELRRTVTIVMVTHGMQQAIRISDDTVFLNHGVVIEHGPTDQLFHQPLQVETEAFVTGRFG